MTESVTGFLFLVTPGTGTVHRPGLKTAPHGARRCPKAIRWSEQDEEEEEVEKDEEEEEEEEEG